MQRNKASFRDPSGYVLENGASVYRIILGSYADEWQALQDSGFPEWAPQMIPYEVLPKSQWPRNVDDKAIAVLKSPKLPFISYPYEWCFTQLKEAALLTLDLHLAALQKGFVLKDATAYNVQFAQGKPVFLDLLSFEKLHPGRPWEAYGQYCSHFLAPLALMSLTDVRLNLLSRQYIDGIPLDLAVKLLPLKSRFSLGLAMHLHMHASMRAKYAETGCKASKTGKTNLNVQQLEDVALSLRRTVASLAAPGQITEWGDYYTDTNYTDEGLLEKERLIARLGASSPGRLALDLGANNGRFSRLLAPDFDIVLATDIDHSAVEYNWSHQRNPKVLPLVLDLASPSPAIGWACSERDSFAQRCKANFVSALALCHHLRITAGIPISLMAEGIGNLVDSGGILVIEFVPKGDSQVQRLLSHRDDIFYDYALENFILAFEQCGFVHKEQYPIAASMRTIHIFQKC